jgi:hypothetical protein
MICFFTWQTTRVDSAHCPQVLRSHHVCKKSFFAENLIKLHFSHHSYPLRKLFKNSVKTVHLGHTEDVSNYCSKIIDQHLN